MLNTHNLVESLHRMEVIITVQLAPMGLMIRYPNTSYIECILFYFVVRSIRINRTQEYFKAFSFSTFLIVLTYQPFTEYLDAGF